MVIQFGQIELDEPSLLVQRSGVRLHIRPKVFDLLVHLVRHRERVVLRDELIMALWGTTAVGPGSLSGLVNELRQVLGEKGYGPSSIRTVHGRGYQFVAEIESGEPGIEYVRFSPRPASRMDETLEARGIAVLPVGLAEALETHVRADESGLESVAAWLQAKRDREEEALGETVPTRLDHRMRRVEPDTRSRRSRFGSA